MEPNTPTYTDQDADVSYLTTETVAVVGYGDEARAQARNLANSGADVLIGLATDSPRRSLARRDGMSVATPREVSAETRIIAMLEPAEHHPDRFADLRQHLTTGDLVHVADASAFDAGDVVPPSYVDVTMLTPVRPGALVRDAYTAGEGVPGLMAVYQDHTGFAFERALAFAKAVGCTRAGVVETTVPAAIEVDHVAKQAARAGTSATHLSVAVEVLTEAGFDLLVARHACLRHFTETLDRLIEEVDGTATDLDDRVSQDALREKLEQELHRLRNPTEPATVAAGKPIPKCDGGTDESSDPRYEGRGKHDPPRGVRHVANVWSRGGEDLATEPDSEVDTEVSRSTSDD